MDEQLRVPVAGGNYQPQDCKPGRVHVATRSTIGSHVMPSWGTTWVPWFQQPVDTPGPGSVPRQTYVPPADGRWTASERWLASPAASSRELDFVPWDFPAIESGHCCTRSGSDSLPSEHPTAGHKPSGRREDARLQQAKLPGRTWTVTRMRARP